MLDKSLKKDYISNNSGSYFLQALALLFIALKLTGHITWTWWWVLAPLWIPFVVVLAVLAIAAIVWRVKFK
jgi:fatty acid desaturase